MKQKLISMTVLITVFVGLLLVGSSHASIPPATTSPMPEGGISTPSSGEDTVEHERAVCNTSPDEKGEYGKEGCEKAYKNIPTAVLTAICGYNTSPVLKECVQNSDGCTAPDGTQGKWCTCTYSCKPINKVKE